MPTHWPETWVSAVHKIKAVFAFFSDHDLLGIPLDLPLRFILLGGLYLALSRWLGRKRAGGLCAGVLLLKEVFDIVAVQNLWRPRAPDWGDVADIASGLLGIVCGEVIIRIRRQTSRPLAGRQPGHSWRFAIETLRRREHE